MKYGSGERKKIGIRTKSGSQEKKIVSQTKYGSSNKKNLGFWAKI